MENLFEGWDRFPYKIYCDMDGVLVNFVGPTLELANKYANCPSLNPFLRKLARRAIEANGRDYFIADDMKSKNSPAHRASRAFIFTLIGGDVEFWASLPWAPGGKELWDHIKKYNPDILTSPTDKACEKGKALWVERNLGLPASKVFFSHKKADYAVCQKGNPTILIDDYPKKIKPFREKGGYGILHTTGDTQSTINILKELEVGNCQET